MVKPRSKNEQLPVRRIPVHELFPQPDMGKRVPPKSTLASIPPLPELPRRAPAKTKKMPKGNIVWALVFLGFILSGFGIFAYTRKNEGQTPYVLLEVRALDEGGHPVTAADVLVNDKKMGVTDSFGEWRRYLQFNPGDEVRIDLAKKDQLSGSKQVEVPRAKGSKQDIEVQVAIAMQRVGGSKAKIKEAVKTEPKTDAPKDAMNVAEVVAAKDKANQKKNTALENLDDELSETGDSSLGIFFDDGLGSIRITAAPNQPKAMNVLDKRQQDVVRERVIPVLANELQGLGLTVEKKAPWKMALSYVPNGDQVGYIRAEIEWLTPFGQTEKTSFIAGFAKTYEETGRGLTSLLRMHMKKTYWAAKENGAWVIDETSETKEFWKLRAGTMVSDTSGERFALALAGEGQGTRRFKLKIGKAQPCEAVRQRSRCMVSTESLKESPPLPGWVQKKVRILGPVPANADVYVAGFQAHALGNNQWEFWGKNGSNLKALIVANGRIIHSEAFKDSPGNALILKMAQNAGKNRAH